LGEGGCTIDTFSFDSNIEPTILIYNKC